MLDVMVRCEACGCSVDPRAGFCIHCGAPVDIKAAQHVSLNDKFSTSPQFNQRLWEDFYVNMLRLGEVFADMISHNSVPPVSAADRGRWSKYALFQDMYCAKTLRQDMRMEANSTFASFEEELLRFPGMSSYGVDVIPWGNNFSIVDIGFILNADGTSFKSRTGTDWKIFGFEMEMFLMKVQECYIMRNCPEEDLLCEQYVSKLEYTRFGMFCKDKGSGFFASDALTHWKDTPHNFHWILHNPKYCKKFVKYTNYGLIDTYVADEMRKFGGNIVQSVLEGLTAVKNYSQWKLAEILKVDTDVSDKEIQDAKNWLTVNLGNPELIIEV